MYSMVSSHLLHGDHGLHGVVCCLLQPLGGQTLCVFMIRDTYVYSLLIYHFLFFFPYFLPSLTLFLLTMRAF